MRKDRVGRKERMERKQRKEKKSKQRLERKEEKENYLASSFAFQPLSSAVLICLRSGGGWLKNKQDMKDKWKDSLDKFGKTKWNGRYMSGNVPVYVRKWTGSGIVFGLSY